MKALAKKGWNRRPAPPAAELGVAALLLCSLFAACALPSGPGAAAPTTTMARAAPASAPAAPTAAPRVADPRVTDFHQHIQPILKANCYECHGDGKSEAGIAFDKLTTEAQILKNPGLWLKVLLNTRAGIMPADGNPRLTVPDQNTLDNWIKFSAFGVDPQHLDPGRVTAHRLNRLEYHNTIHDLLGVNFDTEKEFPSDDIGYGFDNIADVLNVSPLLMEKYLAAAQTVVDQAVPNTSRVMATQSATGRQFVGATAGVTGAKMSYFTAAKVSHTFKITQEGDYDLTMEEGLGSDITFTTANCTVTVTLDDKQASQTLYPWHGTNYGSEIYPSWFETFHVHWRPGDHQVTFNLKPGATGVRSVIAYQVRKVTVAGPTDPAQWKHPANYSHFFPREDPPADPAERRAYARELLGAFASKAFRRPVPEESLDHLVAIAEKIYRAPGKTFEQGVAQAMVAVLASPRFIFRIDQPEVGSNPAAPFVPVDDYALASRLSYFLWSTMPDDELMKLAAAGQLRQNLAAQVQRMVADPRSDAFIQNFSGQWLQSRAVLTVPLSAHDILQREGIDATDADEVTPAQRAALNDEAAAYFGYVMRNDRSINEFIESNYTFLNSVLAGYYGDPAARASGAELRKVELPPGDWRGGVLTLGSVMMVTSNPTRTSPVKRGAWVLENILGAPSPPPPPNVPPLEEAGKKTAGRTPTMRETLAAHRASPVCASCHDRMDPLGLAMENFDALGCVRTKDLGQPIDATGRLSTGEPFKDVRDLKHILVTNHRDEFYRCLTAKLLTYALGRGTEYYDAATIDKIVEGLDMNGGHFSSLLNGVINSAAFQEERTLSDEPSAPTLSLNSPRP
jgi:mono/diheme cytochrome c family protein